MLATASPTDAANSLLGFKFSPSTRAKPVLHVYNKTRSVKSVPGTPVSGRGVSTPVESDKTPERSLKRKSPPNDQAKSVTKLKKQSARSTPEPGNGVKRSRSARLGSRRHSREPADYLYTPPPKRARSDQPFGSKEKPVPRSCSNVLDGRVDQHASEDVVRSLLSTYKAYFMNPEDPSDKSWQIIDGECPRIYLEYPNTGAKETFPLIIPRDPQHYNPIMELSESLEHIVKHYVSAQYRPYFGTLSTTSLTSTLDNRSNNEHPDLLQALRSAEHARDGPRFIRIMSQINAALRSLKHGLDPGSCLASIDNPNSTLFDNRTDAGPNLLHMATRKWCGVPVPIWKAVLAETYQRCIGPSVQQLKEYTPHSSETYGELEANFISDIVHHCGVTPSSRFVDLGCGVGNVVLQLSLQAGCETYGIELRSKLVTLAEKQRTELEKRCRMWGVTVNGNVELEQGDFRESQRAREKLREADVVLVNNFKFGPDLNADLANMFLDMREGAIVVTLAPLLPESFRINIHTMHNPLAIFGTQQEERQYHPGSVSWSNVGGKYFIHRVNRAPLRNFEEQNRPLIEAAASRGAKYNPRRSKSTR